MRTYKRQASLYSSIDIRLEARGRHLLFVSSRLLSGFLHSLRLGRRR